MEEIKKKFNSIDEYILQFPLQLREKLQALRKVIKESVPDAKRKDKLSNANYCFT
ncbi:uncharacterized protein YdhG (YjbR/CyaY superfamily) [Bacillus sp. SLBN-46]|uniref:hypothetical protein n=1 Tax=Bacillus sp. SLBN-46 TaxID=3042283 RepID=UPI00285A3CA0|nr:uncharacterized protein YdhG (YjbR/CyaY superfamily) [Bacillus sp. SLBN-46]